MSLMMSLLLVFRPLLSSHPLQFHSSLLLLLSDLTLSRVTGGSSTDE